MRYAPMEAIDTGSTFEKIKRQYKAKRKAKTDTIQYEVMYKKAQDADKARLRKLEAKM